MTDDGRLLIHDNRIFAERGVYCWNFEARYINHAKDCIKGDGVKRAAKGGNPFDFPGTGAFRQRF